MSFQRYRSGFPRSHHVVFCLISLVLLWDLLRICGLSYILYRLCLPLHFPVNNPSHSLLLYNHSRILPFRISCHCYPLYRLLSNLRIGLIIIFCIRQCYQYACTVFIRFRRFAKHRNAHRIFFLLRQRYFLRILFPPGPTRLLLLPLLGRLPYIRPLPYKRVVGTSPIHKLKLAIALPLLYGLARCRLLLPSSLHHFYQIGSPISFGIYYYSF